MWTKTQVAAHQRALAVAQKWDEPIRRLEEMAKHSPALQDRVAELRARRDMLYQLAATATAIDPTGEK